MYNEPRGHLPERCILPDGRVVERAELEDMPLTAFFEALDVTTEDLYFLTHLDRDSFIFAYSAEYCGEDFFTS
ncbi:hypothetical protein FACS1894202_01490 [Clostridia bacterium]|nr:hypothetical protein FACS1894202_01490 [Clostridia bacterium]